MFIRRPPERYDHEIETVRINTPASLVSLASSGPRSCPTRPVSDGVCKGRTTTWTLCSSGRIVRSFASPG